MAQTQALIAALKQVLKSRNVTYAEIARRLRMSEASIKRVFAKQTFTLDRLDKICGILGIAITDLAKMVEHEAERVTQLTLEQEREIVADPKLMLVAVHALNLWTLEEMVAHYTISKTDCIRLLARLDRLRIIDLLPNNRIRVIVGRNFQVAGSRSAVGWIPRAGPEQQVIGDAAGRFGIDREFWHSAVGIAKLWIDQERLQIVGRHPISQAE